jgi:hypothetical protein
MKIKTELSFEDVHGIFKTVIENYKVNIEGIKADSEKTHNQIHFDFKAKFM